MKTSKDGRVDKMYSMSVSPCYLKPIFLWTQMPQAQMSVVGTDVVGTNVCGHKYLWAPVSVGTNVGGHKCHGHKCHITRENI